MKIEYIKVKELQGYEFNTRTHSDEQVAQLAASIGEFGFTNPLLIDGERQIIAGHGRLAAAIKIGMEDVPCIVLDHLSEAQRRAYVIADNKLALNAGWDEDLLKLELSALDQIGFDLSVVGFNSDELAGLVIDEDIAGGLTDEDDVPEVVDIPISKQGDIWLLDNHRVMCGDSTSADDVALLMDGERANMCFTSPPYNAGDNIRGHFYENDDDNKSQDDYTYFLNNFTNLALDYSDYVFVNIQMLEGNKISIIDYQYNFRNQIKDVLIWNKKIYPPHINKGTFGCKWEYIIAFSDNGKSRSFPCNWQGKYSNVIETENNSINKFADIHKAGFPVSFPYWVIDKMDFAKLVLDPFLGTGTTLIAAEKTNRKCYGMELDPKYVDVIVKRWQEYTGKQAVHEVNSLTFDEVADAKQVA